MIIVVRKGADSAQLVQLEKDISSYGLEIDKLEGTSKTVWGLVGDTSTLDVERLAALPAVEFVKRIQKPYKLVSRDYKAQDTIVRIKNDRSEEALIGGGNFALIAGPCSVESEEQILTIARSVKASGANILRGGAFKPRTSPYAFQGLKEEGIKLLKKAGDAVGLPIVTEVIDTAHLKYFDDVDLIQVGARNMQNYELLKALGKQKKPVLLKRGNSATLQEFLQSAEYIANGGNENIILCERGIRTFETATRNTLDISAVPLLKSMTPLPVIVDPSHATGISNLVTPMSLASVAAGACGLMVEVHNSPGNALSDGAQSLDLLQFEELSRRIAAIRPFAY